MKTFGGVPHYMAWKKTQIPKPISRVSAQVAQAKSNLSKMDI